MININDQLKQLPSEFIVEMEKQKKDRWNDVFNYLVKYFHIEKDIKEAQEAGFDLIDFFKKIHDMGFYGGINFALDPQEPYNRKSKA